MKCKHDKKQTVTQDSRAQRWLLKPTLLFVLCAVLVLFFEPMILPLTCVRAKALTTATGNAIQIKQGQFQKGGGYSPQRPPPLPPIQRQVPTRRKDMIDGDKSNQENEEDRDTENSPIVEPENEIQALLNRNHRKRASRHLPAKLLPPRIPYLSELALAIDERIRELAKFEALDSEMRFLKALEIARGSEDRIKEKELLTYLGHLYYLTGQFHKATAKLERALSIARVLGSVQEEAALLRDMAAAFTGWGEYERAVKFNELALRLSTGSGDAITAQMVRNNMAVIEKNRGEYQSARRMFDDALKYHKEDSTIKILILKNLGNLCRQWGEFDCAQKNYESMIESAQALYDPKQAAEAHLRLAELFASRNLYEQSLDQIRKSLSLLEMTGEPVDIASKLMGDVCLDLGMTDKAMPYLNKAGYASSLGRLKLLQSQPLKAKQHYLKLLSAAKQAGNKNALFTAHAGLGMAAEALGNYEKSAEHYTKAVAVLEDIRSSLLPSERKNFFAVRINGFRRSMPGKKLVKIAVKRGKPEDSVYPSEATRQRTFADNLSSRGKGAYFGVPRKILTEEAQLATKLASLKVALNVLPEYVHPERYRNLGKQIREAQSTFQSFVNRLRNNYKNYASVKYPKPVTLQNALLRPDEYVLLMDQVADGIALRLLQGKHVLHSTFVKWSLKEQTEMVKEFRKPFEMCRLKSFDCDLAGRLYQMLLSGALKQVPHGSRVIIIPDGVWAIIPFEALVAKGKATWSKSRWGPYPDGVTYVGDLWDITYYQSLTAMTLVRRLKARTETGSRLLVMADPVFSIQDARAKSNRYLAQETNPSQVVLMEASASSKNTGFINLKRLHETGVLAKNLKTLFGQGCDTFTGFDCSKRAFVDQITPKLSQYKYLIFATHGFASNSIPGIMEPVLWLSTIPRGSGGSLTMSEVAGLKMDADLAALTACQTGLGQLLAGEGVMSMGRAFQCAGAKSVFMSLWGVYEPSSVTLTEEFFRSLRQGKSKYEALRLARDYIRQEGYQHPFYWSAFILVGEND